jgi:hypothetical protein
MYYFIKEAFVLGKNKIIISIAGSELVVMTEESREYTLKLASIVDEKIRALLKSNSKITLPMASILTCLDLCDDNEKNKASAERLRDEINNYFKQNSALSNQVDKLTKENYQLKKRLESYTDGQVDIL